MTPDIQVAGKRVLVYSMGIEGRDLASWLLRHGATVTMSDTRSEAQLAAANAHAPAGVSEVVCGGPLLDPAGFDLVAVSQSVLRHDPAMRRVREAGIPATSQMRLFLQLCKGRTVGITGSAGKSTTTSLVGAMADVAGCNPIVGGNLGQALLARVDEIAENQLVVLEISHTQLQYTDRSPGIGAITNVTPNHLDQFSWDEYVGLKRNLIAYQEADDIAILNADDRTSRTLMPAVRGSLHLASTRTVVVGDGAWLEGDQINRRRHGDVQTVALTSDSTLRGDHNVANVVMAVAIASAIGLAPDAMAKAIRGFKGVPHRLELVGVAGGVTYVNDSIATAPERTIAGLKAFQVPVVLLLGGREKKLPLSGLVEEARTRCRSIVCFGESGPVFHAAMSDGGIPSTLVTTLEDAVKRAREEARPGDVVLLAPAGTSFDAYPSFEARGAAFRALVKAIPGLVEEEDR